MSLRRRLLASIAFLLAASLLAGGVLTYFNGVRRVEVEMTSALNVGVNAVRDIVQRIDGNDSEQQVLRRIIASFDGDRHVQAKLISEDGSVRATSYLRAPGEASPDWLYRMMAGSERHVDIALRDGQGAIRLIAEPLNEVTEVWEDAQLKLAIVGSFCTLALVMISITLGRALKPLEDLSAALQQVAGGNYQAHVSEKGPEELAAIYRGFNAMAEKLDEAEQNNRQLNTQLATVQDEERAEIARDLHDEIGPFLFAADVDAQTIPGLLERTTKDEVIGRAQAIRQSISHMQTHLRAILQRLQPGHLVDLGLQQAVEQLGEFWNARYPSLRFEIDCNEKSFGAKIDEVAFRVLQEGTSNAIRHGAPSLIKLSARRMPTGDIEIAVSDDGSGIQKGAGKGFGLSGMRDRIGSLGGSLTIGTEGHGRGVKLTATFPAMPVADCGDPHRKAMEKNA